MNKILQGVVRRPVNPHFAFVGVTRISGLSHPHPMVPQISNLFCDPLVNRGQVPEVLHSCFSSQVEISQLCSVFFDQLCYSIMLHFLYQLCF